MVLPACKAAAPSAPTALPTAIELASVCSLSSAPFNSADLFENLFSINPATAPIAPPAAISNALPVLVCWPDS